VPVSFTSAQRRDRLAHRHLLLPSQRTDDVVRIAEALVALHSTDPVTVYLSVLSRMRTPSLTAVDQALYADRSLIRHHAMRRTLWVAPPETVRAMHASTTEGLSALERRRTVAMLRDNGIADAQTWLDRARDHVLAALAEHGPMTARQLGRLVPELARPLVLARGKPYQGTQSAHSRVLTGLGFDGRLVRGRPIGSWINGQYTWAAMDDWLPGGVDGMDGRMASARLALSWLGRFGPGTTKDLQWWAGWTLGTTRRALEDCAAQPVDLDDAPGWVAPGDVAASSEPRAAEHQPTDPDATDRQATGSWVALLPGLDPTVMGWKDRDFYLPPEAAPAWDRNGNAGPTIWVDGRVVGAWGQARNGEIRLHWFTDVSAEATAQAAVRAEEIRDWLGEVRFSVRFPGAVNKELLA
jgi:hypothetical protein